MPEPHPCPRCQTKHRGEFDHCEGCRSVLSPTHTLRRNAKGCRSIGVGWREHTWYADGERPTLKMQGNADDIRAIAELIRAELAAREPCAVVHIVYRSGESDAHDMPDAMPGEVPTAGIGRVLIELHGDAIGLPNNGPTHRSRKMDLMRILRSHVRRVMDEWDREIRAEDARRFAALDAAKGRA